MLLSQAGIIHHIPSVTNVTGSCFGHNLDVVVLKLPEFILSASGCLVGTERKHLWGLVPLPAPSQSSGWRNTWHQPSKAVAGVLTAQLRPRRRLKPFHSCFPLLAARNICSLKTYGHQQNLNSLYNENSFF